jgi:hypothetical protein
VHRTLKIKYLQQTNKMAMRPQLRLLLLVAGLLVCAQLQQTAAMPMHPDLLSFIKLPAASDPSEQLQQTAARKLQQDPLFEEGGGEAPQLACLHCPQQTRTATTACTSPHRV